MTGDDRGGAGHGVPPGGPCRRDPGGDARRAAGAYRAGGRPARGPGRGPPAGPLEPAHPTLERGLRAWVERQTGQTLGYVEQLYTFGDRNRRPGTGDGGRHALSVAYLALVREARPAADSAWQCWYRYFPYEDWRAGRPPALDALQARLEAWAAATPDPEEQRRRSTGSA